MHLPVKKTAAPPEKADPPVITDAQIVDLRSKGKISKREGLHLFDRFLEQKFPAEILAGLLEDLTKATDTKHAQGVGLYETPNWDARAEGLKMALEVTGALPDSDSRQPQAPKSIVFNVVPSKPAVGNQK